MGYKITLQKNQLGFLKNYKKVNDKEFGKYLILNLSKESSGKYMAFELTTTEVDVVTKLPNETLELTDCTEKSLTFRLSDFHSFIDLVTDEEIILEDNIFKTKNGSYPICELSNEVSRQTIVSLINKDFTQIKLTQLEKLKVLKSYIGSEEEKMDAILYQNDNYSAYGGAYFCTVIGSGTQSDPVYLSPRMVDVLDSMDIESVTINLQKEQNVIVIKHEETIYFFKINKKYRVPDLVSETLKPKWCHQYKVQIKLDDFTNILNKFKVLSDEESIKLLYKFTLVNNTMRIETMNSVSGQAFESINAEYSTELEGIDIPLSVGHTLTALKAFAPNSVENVTLFLKPDNPEVSPSWVSSFGLQGDDDESLFVILPTLSKKTEE